MVVAPADLKPVAQEVKLGLEAARGAFIALHAAAGLVRGNPVALRLLRGAEGLCRSATAQLEAARRDQQPAPRQGEEKAKELAATVESGAGTSRSARRRRKRRAAAARAVSAGQAETTGADAAAAGAAGGAEHKPSSPGDVAMQEAGEAGTATPAASVASTVAAATGFEASQLAGFADWSPKMVEAEVARLCEATPTKEGIVRLKTLLALDEKLFEDGVEAEEEEEDLF